MKQSLTYYLTLLALKLKRVKNDFSKDPIDYKKIRKEDVLIPKGSFYKENIVRRIKISNTKITEVSRESSSDKLLIFIHGGAFISGPGKHHWDTIKEIASQTDFTIWMCDYPKAPEHKISVISNNIDAVYKKALESYPSNQIALIGDSAGGTLISALIQGLVSKSQKVPNKIILVSPVMDASMTNPEIESVDDKDPMLSKIGVLSAKRMCAETVGLKSPLISPLYGSFEGFPKTFLFLAENDISYPDQRLAVEKLKDSNTELEVIVGKNMPHIWPLLPVMKEAKDSLKEIIRILNAVSR